MYTDAMERVTSTQADFVATVHAPYAKDLRAFAQDPALLPFVASRLA